MIKKILLITTLLFCSCILTFAPYSEIAKADTGNFILISENITGEVYFRTVNTVTGEKEILFSLPKTYYVRQRQPELSTDNYHLVEYKGISGFVSASEISDKPSILTDRENPYDGFASNLRIIDSESMALHSQPKFSSAGNIVIPASGEITFIGALSNDSCDFLTGSDDRLWYYVNYNGNYGYVPSNKTNLTKLTYTKHPDSLITVPETPTNGATDTTTPPVENNLLTTLLAIGIVIPSVLLIIIIFKPNKYSNNKMKNNLSNNVPNNYDRNVPPPYGVNTQNNIPPQYGYPPQQPMYPPQNNGYPPQPTPPPINNGYPPQPPNQYPPQNGYNNGDMYQDPNYPPQSNIYPPQNNNYYDPNYNGYNNQEYYSKKKKRKK